MVWRVAQSIVLPRPHSYGLITKNERRATIVSKQHGGDRYIFHTDPPLPPPQSLATCNSYFKLGLTRVDVYDSVHEMELNSQADPTEVQLLQALPLGFSARVRGSGLGFEPRTGPPEGSFAALSWQQQTHTLAHGTCMHTFRSEGVALFSPTLSATCAPSEPYAPPWLGTSSAPPSSAPPYPLRPPPHSSHLQPLQLCGASVPVATRSILRCIHRIFATSLKHQAKQSSRTFRTLVLIGTAAVCAVLTLFSARGLHAAGRTLCHLPCCAG